MDFPYQDFLSNYLTKRKKRRKTRYKSTVQTRVYHSIKPCHFNTNRNFLHVLYKNLLHSAWLWSRGRLVIEKTQKYFSLPDQQLVVDQVLVFGLYEMKKEDKSQFVTNDVGIIVTIILRVKSLLHSVSSMITWSTKL